MNSSVRIFVALLVAIGLAIAALYVIDRAITPGGEKKSMVQVRVERPAPRAMPKANPVAAQKAPEPAPAPAPVSINSARLPLLFSVTSAAANTVIVKCSSDGKIVYTDKGCPQGSKTKSLQIVDNAVIPGYDRATIDNTFRVQPPASTQAQLVPSGGVIEPARSISTEPNLDCVALRRRYDWLNDTPYRRQLPHVYDRRRRERDELQTRMFWSHC